MKSLKIFEAVAFVGLTTSTVLANFWCLIAQGKPAVIPSFILLGIYAIWLAYYIPHKPKYKYELDGKVYEASGNELVECIHMLYSKMKKEKTGYSNFPYS